MRYITDAIGQPPKGFLPSAISMMLIPRDHTSLFNEPSLSYTSGPMYHSVPHTVWRFEQECSSCAASPKSPSLMSPWSEMNRLSGLMSYDFIQLPIHYSMDHVPVVKVGQSQQATTHHISQDTLIQPISVLQMCRKGTESTILHHELFHQSDYANSTLNSFFLSITS